MVGGSTERRGNDVWFEKLRVREIGIPLYRDSPSLCEGGEARITRDMLKSSRFSGHYRDSDSPTIARCHGNDAKN